MNSDEFSNYTLLSYDINKDGQGREDAIFQLKPYIDTESKLVNMVDHSTLNYCIGKIS
jgi:hypothetical protein